MQQPIFDIQKIEEQTGYFSEDISAGCSSTYLEFVRQEGDLFLFYTEIKNNSQDTLVVYPQEIYLEVVKDYDEQDDQMTNRYFAIDPAHEIDLIDHQMKEEKDRHTEATVLNVVFGVFNTVANLVGDSDYKEESVATTVFNTGVSQVDEEIYHADTEKDLNEIKDFWMNSILNEPVVCPDDTVSGLVYLPYSPTAEIFKVVIPVCGFPDSFLFKQVQRNK